MIDWVYGGKISTVGRSVMAAKKQTATGTAAADN